MYHQYKFKLFVGKQILILEESIDLSQAQ